MEYCTTIGADVSDRTTKICIMTKADGGERRIVLETTCATTKADFEEAFAVYTNAVILAGGTVSNYTARTSPVAVDTDGDGIGDTGGYVYVVCNTAETGLISDGGYWDNKETYGGFFGDTKFYYTEEDYFTGPNYPFQTLTETFAFR